MFLEKCRPALRALVAFMMLFLGIGSAHAIEFSVAEFDGPVQCAEEARSLGLKHCVIYIRLGSSDRYNVARLPDDFEATVVIKLSEDYDLPHQAMIEGQYDSHLRRLAEQIKADGRPITLRIMAEGNSFWNYDAAYREGQDPESYKMAYRYAVDFLRNIIGESLIRDLELNFNFASFGYDKKRIESNDFALLDPGPRYRTLVSFSGYNRCGTTSDFTSVRTFDDLFAKAIGQARSAFPGVPLGIAEIGSTPYCGVDLVAWWSDALAKAEAAGLVRVGLFLNPDPDIGETERPEQWDAVYTDHLPEFQQLLQRYGAGQAVIKEGRVSPKSATLVAEASPPSLRPSKPFMTRLRDGWEFPGSFYGDVKYVDGTDISALSPLSGEPFGDTGLIGRFQVRQSALHPLGAFDVGPSFTLSLVQSGNHEQWWNNNAEVGIGLIAERDLPFFDWGSVRFYIEGKYRRYTVDTPDYIGGDDVLFQAGVTTNFGWDWR